MGIVFVDTETTGTDPNLHEVWEIALIEENGQEHVWRRWPARERMQFADSYALLLSGFYTRVDYGSNPAPAEALINREPDMSPSDHSDLIIARSVAILTAGHHLVGAVPSFDARFLDFLMRRNGVAPAWHYHLVDVEAMAAGKLGVAPPWDSRALAEELGVPELDGKHTALGDARWAKAMYEAALRT